MQKDETRCFLCGSEVAPDRSKVTLQQRFSSVVKVALVLAFVMTVASLFTDWVPSFTKCITATLVLGLVQKSATQMNANRL